MADRKLYNEDVAEYLGISAATWRGYRSTSGGRRRKQAPEPDGTSIEGGHARPWWWETTISAWNADRPGKGTRTDLKPEAPAKRTRKRV